MVSKRSKIRSAFPKERIHFAFLQFRKGRRNRLEITLRKDVFFNGGCSLFCPFRPDFPRLHSLSLFPPFKALVSLTIQILIQLRRWRHHHNHQQWRISCVSPSFFFFSSGYIIFSSLISSSLFFSPIPAKSEFNYDSSRNRFTSPPLTPWFVVYLTLASRTLRCSFLLSFLLPSVLSMS